jgi:hypothetical protein
MRYLTTTLLVIAFGGSYLLSPFALPTTASSLSRTALSRAMGARARQDTEAITEANWQQHPKIRAIRKMVASVDAGVKRGTFKTSQRRFDVDNCNDGSESLRRMAVDSKGIVRRYKTRGGTEDYLLTFQHYYDEAGRLRFVYIIGGAVNGTRIQHRIYFDEAGKRIWEAHKQLSGLGKTGFSDFPDDQLSISNPAKDFAAASPCPELKPRPRHRHK